MANRTEEELRELEKLMPCVPTSLVYAQYKQFPTGRTPCGSIRPIGFFGKVIEKYSELDTQLLGYQIEAVEGHPFVDSEEYEIPHHARFRFHEPSGLYLLREEDLGDIGVEPIFNIFETMKFAREQKGEKFAEILTDLLQKLKSY